MNLTATTQSQSGFTAFASFGMRWAKPADQAQAGRQDRQARASASQAIDVEATPVVEVQVEPVSDNSRMARQLQLVSADHPMTLDPKVASYAPPTQSGQAPRLLYAAQPRGQLFESWA